MFQKPTRDIILNTVVDCKYFFIKNKYFLTKSIMNTLKKYKLLNLQKNKRVIV